VGQTCIGGGISYKCWYRRPKPKSGYTMRKKTKQEGEKVYDNRERNNSKVIDHN
jgi:hypothetical protein